MSVSVVIPVYNGSETLDELIQRLGQVLPSITNSFEVILVNDGSSDGSWDVIMDMVERHTWVLGIDLMRNTGQENATLCGIRAASRDVIVTMDDDLQHLPEEMPKLLDKLNEGYDVVYGVPYKRCQQWWKNLFSVLIKRAIAYVMGLHVVQDISAYKVFRADLRRAFDNHQGPDVMVDVLLSWGTNRYASVSVEEAPRTMGRSNYNMSKLVKVAFLILTSYTTLPLRLASILGFVFFIFGFCVLLYVLVTYLVLGSVPGFSFQASIISIFSGVQLFALGIIGEYLARMFARSMAKPPYIIRSMVGREQ